MRHIVTFFILQMAAVSLVGGLAMAWHTKPLWGMPIIAGLLLVAGATTFHHQGQDRE